MTGRHSAGRTPGRLVSHLRFAGAVAAIAAVGILCGAGIAVWLASWPR